jgi:hypothetical protein
VQIPALRARPRAFHSSRPLLLLALLCVALQIGNASRAAAQEATGGYSASFDVNGSIAHAQFALADLQALPQVTENVQFRSGQGMEQRSYTGVRLYDLLTALSPQFDAARKNDKLDWYVQVVGSDGYKAIIAWGEIDPGWEAKDVLVAYSADGQLLGPGDGMAKLVVPGDIQGGRYVSNIMAITLMPASP